MKPRQEPVEVRNVYVRLDFCTSALRKSVLNRFIFQNEAQITDGNDDSNAVSDILNISTSAPSDQYNETECDQV